MSTATLAVTSDAVVRTPTTDVPRVRALGRTEYTATWQAMQIYTAERGASGADELWLTEHPPVYTVGIAGRAEHLPRTDNGIAVVRCDRGGQVTYHGPGQVVLYLLVDLRRRALSVRTLVRRMENAVIDSLADYGIAARGRPEAPGVYVGDAKIAALGLRVRNGCAYHGLALNVDMDLAPFAAIDPCGYPGLAVTQTHDLGIRDSPELLGAKLAQHMILQLA